MKKYVFKYEQYFRRIYSIKNKEDLIIYIYILF